MADDNWWTEIARRNEEQEPGGRRPAHRSDLATEPSAREGAPEPGGSGATGADALPATEPTGIPQTGIPHSDLPHPGRPNPGQPQAGQPHTGPPNPGQPNPGQAHPDQLPAAPAAAALAPAAPAAGIPLTSPAVSLFEPSPRPAEALAEHFAQSGQLTSGPPHPRTAEPGHRAVPDSAEPTHVVPPEPPWYDTANRTSHPDDPTLTMPAVQAGPPSGEPGTSPQAHASTQTATSVGTPQATVEYSAAPSVTGADEDEVPFWLLPAPPRPGAPVPAGQGSGHAVAHHQAPSHREASPHGHDGHHDPAPTGRDNPVGQPALAGTHNPTTQHSPTEAIPPAGHGEQPRATVLPSRREALRGGDARSVGARAGTLLAKAVATVGPFAARVRALDVPQRVRSAPPVMLAATAAFAVGLVVVLVSVLSLGNDGDTAPTATPGASGSAAARPAPVDPKTVTASASSEQDPDSGTTYVAANTLDGKLATAWNSDGRPDSGLTLTYTFDAPVDLRSVTVSNGYQKVKSSGRNRDLFRLNSRAKQVRIVTDNGSWDWTLKDAKAAQTLIKKFGATKTVRIEIESAYKGSSYSDVAVSEVSFTAL